MIVATFIFCGGLLPPIFFTTLFSQIIATSHLHLPCHPLSPIKYFAAPENQDLGVVKYLRKPVPKLDLSPFPAPS
ncbi:hypothetical protein CEN45_11875 [Fischerella thermalis CCMEE 5198]|jgi:hypothetical protein|nr:hypothetical protein CI594_21725 [Fischerella thermalis CCMEE 5196]PMB22767.1 hypothetical protein CEN45_11875 [Fischerella thermalis CCMEE 5198]